MVAPAQPVVQVRIDPELCAQHSPEILGCLARLATAVFTGTVQEQRTEAGNAIALMIKVTVDDPTGADEGGRDE